MFLFASVMVFFVDEMAKSNFLNRFLCTRFRTATFSNVPWASFPCTFSTETFKIFLVSRFASFKEFSFPRKVLYSKSFWSSFCALTASPLSLCSNENHHAAWSSALTTVYRAFLSKIYPVSSVFRAVLALPSKYLLRSALEVHATGVA